MRAVFYTETIEEYRMLSEKLLEEMPDTELHYIEQDGHFRFVDSDMIVVTLNGARGMETVIECSSRYPRAMIVWVTDDEYFARMAIRRHIFDFILRPLTEERFSETVRNAAVQRGWKSGSRPPTGTGVMKG